MLDKQPKVNFHNIELQKKKFNINISEVDISEVFTIEKKFLEVLEIFKNYSREFNDLLIAQKLFREHRGTSFLNCLVEAFEKKDEFFYSLKDSFLLYNIIENDRAGLMRSSNLSRESLHKGFLDKNFEYYNDYVAGVQVEKLLGLDHLDYHMKLRDKNILEWFGTSELFIPFYNKVFCKEKAITQIMQWKYNINKKLSIDDLLEKFAKIRESALIDPKDLLEIKINDIIKLPFQIDYSNKLDYSLNFIINDFNKYNTWCSYKFVDTMIVNTVDLNGFKILVKTIYDNIKNDEVTLIPKPELNDSELNYVILQNLDKKHTLLDLFINYSNDFLNFFNLINLDFFFKKFIGVKEENNVLLDFEKSYLLTSNLYNSLYSDLSKLFIYILFSILIALLLVILSNIFSLKKKYNEKLSAYECGFEPFEDARNIFDIQFYLVAILFIIFDLEVAFLFPWSIALYYISFKVFISMCIFLLLLTIGFIYEWKKGALEWD